jgi:hypothetical protein
MRAIADIAVKILLTTVRELRAYCTPDQKSFIGKEMEKRINWIGSHADRPQRPRAPGATL